MRSPARQQQPSTRSGRTAAAAASKAKAKAAETVTEKADAEMANNRSSNGSNASSSSKENHFASSGARRGRPRRIAVDAAAAVVAIDEADEADSVSPRKKARLTKSAARAAAAAADSSPEEAAAGRRNIKRIMQAKEISAATKQAEVAERERLRRIAERQQQELKQQRRQRQPQQPKLKEEKYEEQAEEKPVAVVNNRSPRSRSRPPSSPSPPPPPPLVLERAPDTGAPLIDVAPRVCRRLKPHQSEAVQFLYDCLYESAEETRRGSPGSGALLAHCMGLGKTLSVIAFLHAVMRRASPTAPLGARSVLIVCPLNVALNWANEFRLWLGDEAAQRRCGETPLPIRELTGMRLSSDRLAACRTFIELGGVLIVNYDLFRNLAQGRGLTAKRKQRELYRQALLDPGPDIIVCDEGHVLKSGVTGLAKAMSEVRTRRRIVLTGTPLQNNLMEYFTMVSFVKPSLLGNQKEFANRFVNPISNGQHSDSTEFDVRLMKRRAHVLHRMLAGCVHRRDYTALTRYLPPKHEYIINVRLGEVQEQMYRKYLDQVRPLLFSNSVSLFADQQVLYRVWTHPHMLKLHEDEAVRRDRWTSDDDEDSESCEDNSGKEDEASFDEEEDEDKACNQRRQRRRRWQGSSGNESSAADSTHSSSADEVTTGWTTRSRRGAAAASASDDEESSANVPTPRPPQWWHPLYTDAMSEDLSLSGKLHVLFSLLRSFAEHGDKTLVFSQSLFSLDIIEHFLARLAGEGEANDSGDVWVEGEDYLRLDGSTPAASRKAMSEAFNREAERRLRLFLISTKAGGLGVNLPAANRVVIFDVSWNPSHDIQSIFRTYRFGQTKSVYVYRLVAQGTMEEKIYSRQVNKQSLGFRVIDEHQINRHFTAADLVQLYTLSVDRFDPDSDARKRFDLPKDDVLADLLAREARWISSYHLHDSLLENVESELLTDEERTQAWQEYEDEKQAKPRVRQQQMQQQQQQEQMPILNVISSDSSKSAGMEEEDSRSNNCCVSPRAAQLTHSASVANLGGAGAVSHNGGVAHMQRAASSLDMLQLHQPPPPPQLPSHQQAAAPVSPEQQLQQQLWQLRRQYPLQFFNIRGQALLQRPDLAGNPAELNRLTCTYLLDWLRTQKQEQDQRRQQRQELRQQAQQSAADPIEVDD